VYDTPGEAVAGSDFVVVCPPVDRIVSLVEEVAPFLGPEAVVTDVGSVKGSLVRHAAAAVRDRARFVGSHPMAGSDRTGHVHADPDLFRGRPCFVTPLPDTDPDAIQRVVDFWRALDAVVVTEKPETHDEIVAHVSHLPHALASVLCATLAARDRRWRALAGPGLRDTTRIAASDEDLWRAIFQLTRDEVLRSIRAFQQELEFFQAALANDDLFAVRAILERGRDYREGLGS
jgi:prephenate dehydrogenase